MQSYGQIVETGYQPYYDEIYEGFADYFQNPDMVKVKNVDKSSMYAVRIFSMLGFEQRYLIVLVPQDHHDTGYRVKLNSLKWTSLQTRTLTDNYNVLTHSYLPRRTPFVMKQIKLINQTPSGYIYEVLNGGYTVYLLPTNNKSLEYSITGTVVTALETYQTIITFN